MHPLQFAVPVGVLEAADGYLQHVVFLLVLANVATRMLAHRRHRRQVEEGAESLSRFYPHWAVSALLVLAVFAYTVVHPHGGIVLSVLATGTFVSDFFEFEARNVEARNDMEFEKPKGALTVSVLLVLYAAYQSLFFLIAGYWNAVV